MSRFCNTGLGQNLGLTLVYKTRWKTWPRPTPGVHFTCICFTCVSKTTLFARAICSLGKWHKQEMHVIISLNNLQKAICRKVKEEKKETLVKKTKLLHDLVREYINIIESKKRDMKTNNAKKSIIVKYFRNLMPSHQKQKEILGHIKELCKRMKLKAKKDISRVKKHQKRNLFEHVLDCNSVLPQKQDFWLVSSCISTISQQTTSPALSSFHFWSKLTVSKMRLLWELPAQRATIFVMNISALETT